MTLYRRYLDLLMRVPGDGRRLGILVVLMTISAALEALGVGLIMPFIALLQSPERLDDWPVFRGLAVRLGAETPAGAAMLLGGILLLVFVAKNLYLAATQYVQMRFLYNRMTLLSRDMLASYLSRPYTFFLARNSAALVRNVVNDVAQLFYSAMPSAFVLVIETLTCVVLAALLVVLEPVAIPAVALVIGGGGYVFQRFFRKRSVALGHRVRERETTLVQRASQAFGGIKEVRVRGCEPFIVSTYAATSREHAASARVARTLASVPRYTFETLAVAGMVLVAGIVLARGGGTERLVPLLGVMALAVVRLMPSAVRILGALADLRYYQPTVEALHDDLRAGAPLPEPAPALSFARELRLEEVSYTYPGATTASLDRVSLCITRGESVALVGASGAGKTTLADLLIGLLEPTSGEIVADGTVLRGPSLRAWQRIVGYVPQSVYLADDTLRRNVAFGEPDDAVDEERLGRALEAARLTELVHSLDDGLDTVVGERGVRLSGGQRQRIGIARALYFDPKVLVLDEATSALDGLTEAEVVEAIEVARAERTTIVIAHRLSTVRNCDRIVFMAGGRITQVGRWEDLLASSSDFRRLVELAGQA